MSQLNEQAVRRFILDDVVADSVKEVLLQSFIKKRDGDVQMKAAQMMAVDLLHDSWKELERYKKPANEERKPKQVGI